MDPVGYETTVVTFYVRGTLIFPWWTEVSTSSLFLRALREANDPRAWEQLKILRSLTDALDLGYLKRATEKKKGRTTSMVVEFGGILYQTWMAREKSLGRDQHGWQWNFSQYEAPLFFNIFQITIQKYRTFIYGPCFMLVCPRIYCFILTHQTFEYAMFGVVVWDMILSRSRDPWILDVPKGPFGSRTTPTYGGPLNKSLACICYR